MYEKKKNSKNKHNISYRKDHDNFDFRFFSKFSICISQKLKQYKLMLLSEMGSNIKQKN